MAFLGLKCPVPVKIWHLQGKAAEMERNCICSLRIMISLSSCCLREDLVKIWLKGSRAFEVKGGLKHRGSLLS